MGEKTGLSTLTVFLSLVLWAWVLGPIGALMSVPLMLLVKLLFLDSYDSTRPISALISLCRNGPEGGSDEPATACLSRLRSRARRVEEAIAPPPS